MSSLFLRSKQMFATHFQELKHLEDVYNNNLLHLMDAQQSKVIVLEEQMQKEVIQRMNELDATYNDYIRRLLQQKQNIATQIKIQIHKYYTHHIQAIESQYRANIERFMLQHVLDQDTFYNDFDHLVHGQATDHEETSVNDNGRVHFNIAANHHTQQQSTQKITAHVDKNPADRIENIKIEAKESKVFVISDTNTNNGNNAPVGEIDSESDGSSLSSEVSSIWNLDDVKRSFPSQSTDIVLLSQCKETIQLVQSNTNKRNHSLMSNADDVAFAPRAKRRKISHSTNNNVTDESSTRKKKRGRPRKSDKNRRENNDKGSRPRVCCKICNINCTNNAGLSNHIRARHGIRKLVDYFSMNDCEIKGKQKEMPCDDRNILISPHKYKYKCTVCAKCCVGSVGINSHLRAHVKKGDLSDDEQKKIYKQITMGH